MTNEEAKKAGFRTASGALYVYWCIENGHIYVRSCDACALTGNDFPTREKAREALRRRKMEVATKREDARVAERKAAETQITSSVSADVPSQDGVPYGYRSMPLDTKLNDDDVANQTHNYNFRDAALLINSGIESKGWFVTKQLKGAPANEQAITILLRRITETPAEKGHANTPEGGNTPVGQLTDEAISKMRYGDVVFLADCSGGVSEWKAGRLHIGVRHAYRNRGEAEVAAHKLWLEVNQSQTTPITPEQAKDLRIGDVIAHLTWDAYGTELMGGHAKTIIGAGLLKKQCQVDEIRHRINERCTTHVYYWTFKAAQAALDKAKLSRYERQHPYMDDAQYAACVEARDWFGADLRAEELDGKAKADSEPLEWCERKVGELIEATDSIWDWLSECWQEPSGRHVGEKLERDDMGCVNFRARYRNPLWLAKHVKAVESHETPVGETQGKEVVTDETQRSPSKPLSDAEFKSLVGRMSIPQLYNALKANGIKLEGIGLEPKNVDEQSVLEEAAKCVTGPRRRDYGTPDENFGLISSLWSVQLKHEVTPMQVAMCLILLKIARQANSPKRDNLVDIAGYAQCASELKGAK